MTIQERAIDSIVVLDISGRLVLDDGDAVLTEKVGTLLTQGNRRIVLNVGALSYVDSAGLGALLSSFLAAKSQGCVLRLLNPSKRLHDLLAMTKLLPMVHVCESEAQAIASFDATA